MSETQAALRVAASARGVSQSDGSKHDHDHAISADQTNQNKEEVGETESKVEEYQCTGSHSNNPEPVAPHSHIRKITRRRIKRKPIKTKKKVKKNKNVRDNETEQVGDTNNLSTKLKAENQHNDETTSKDQLTTGTNLSLIHI